MNRGPMPNVIVLGAGVIGLTTALKLLEEGFAVELWTRDDPLATTSAVAAAFWFPYLVQPEDAARRWGRAGYERFVAMAANPASGVTLRPALIVFEEPTDAPSWAGSVLGFRMATRDELPGGYRGGYRFDIPIIEMPHYLPHLLGRVTQRGGRLVRRQVAQLDKAFAATSCVVNCTGLGARELIGDRSLYAVRGQIVRVERPAVDSLLFDPHGSRGVAYIVPRSTDAVLGGTSEVGIEEMTPDPAVAAEIIRRCGGYGVDLGPVQPIESRVGLRPCRPSVRVDAEWSASGGLLVNNYGHGGAGVTLSFGCADEVASLVHDHLANPNLVSM